MNCGIRKSCKEPESSGVEDYRIYKMDLKEKLQCFAEGIVLDLVISLLFYDSFLAMLPGAALIVLYYKQKKKKLMRHRRYRMRCELREYLKALIAALQTGRSVENAFWEALKDTGAYAKDSTEFLEEMQSICTGASLGQPIERLLLDFADRSHLEELEYFAEVFQIGKRSGGNLIGILKNTIRMLQEKMEAEAEIYTVISQAQMEFYIMCVVPLAIIVYLRVFAGGMLESLYGNLLGITVMTVCLTVYGGCYLYGKKLLEIET